jgi:NAD(P)-dependent dehydrogenase (short-subunit alcohol dehydrogenase family)
MVAHFSSRSRGAGAYDFGDKVVLVTGGGSGIGRASALAFAKCGAAVVVCGRSDAGLETARLIAEAGGESFFQRTDVTQPEQVEAAVAATAKRYGHLNFAFNNAGVLPPPAPTADLSCAAFNETIAADLVSVFTCIKFEIPEILKAGGGAIVNNASVGGFVAAPGLSAYVAAKHGVVGLTKAAAVDYARHGIRINAVAPGIVATPMTAPWLNDPALRDLVVGGSPLARAAEPEEISQLVLFLCSSGASFITGHTFPVDGGQSIV